MPKSPSLSSSPPDANSGSLYRHLGGRRAQGGGGGRKARPWHRVDFQLHITKNVDPGDAGNADFRHPLPTLRPPRMAWEGADLQRLARTRSRLTAPVFNALIHASKAVIQVPSTATDGVGGSRFTAYCKNQEQGDCHNFQCLDSCQQGGSNTLFSKDVLDCTPRAFNPGSRVKKPVGILGG